MRDDGVGHTGVGDALFSQCVAGRLDECLLPGVDVHPERARAVQTRAFVAGVVLGDDRGEGLGPVGNDAIR